MPEREADGQAGFLPIADYAVIGDCHSAALVSREGSIDWYCPARFDAPAVFCRILDARKGGYLSLAPVGGGETTRGYAGDTNILETTFSTGAGRVRLTDFMPLAERQPSDKGQDVESSGQILRLVEGLAGDVEMEVCCKPTFNFARTAAELSVHDSGAVATAQGGARGSLALACPGIRLEAAGGAVHGRWHVRAHERHWIALTHAADASAARAALQPGDYDRQLAQTEQYWHDWAGGCSYRGPYRAEVLRSALALKLLTYEPTGAIVAAPTTSLPEWIGGVRNWDYRYTWLRDSALLIYALMTVGYQDEASDFFHWLRRTQEADPTALPQIMYRIDERRDLPEVKLDNLSGYRDSRPVRVGNAASQQLQLDIFGEVLTSAYLHFRHEDGTGKAPAGQPGPGPGQATWTTLRDLVEQAADRWQEPDNGIWEVRGGPQKFLYSRLMCWAALDRGIRLAEDYNLPAPLGEWETARAAIREAILTQGYDARVGAFTQAFGSQTLDASVLVIPRIGFLPPTDQRMRSTIDQIHRQLTHHGLVYRYRTADGLPGGEGTFVPCSFWLVEALALSGQVQDAHDVFVQAAQHSNDLGLISEELAPDSGELLGNFPQGFSHAALINAAVNLAKAERHGPENEPETEAQRAGKASRAAQGEGHS